MLLYELSGEAKCRMTRSTVRRRGRITRSRKARCRSRLPQAAPASGWRGATAGIVPGARLVEFGIVLVRPDRAGRRRVLDDECLCPARLRRLDDGPRELRPLVPHGR